VECIVSRFSLFGSIIHKPPIRFLEEDIPRDIRSNNRNRFDDINHFDLPSQPSTDSIMNGGLPRAAFYVRKVFGG
jgi:hypothetical protein